MNTRYGNINGVKYYASNDKFVTFRYGTTECIILSFDDWLKNGVNALKRIVHCNQQLRARTACNMIKVIEGKNEK